MLVPLIRCNGSINPECFQILPATHFANLEYGVAGVSGRKFTRVIQFSGAVTVSLFPPPETGRIRVGVKAAGVPRPCFPPIPTVPRDCVGGGPPH